MSNPTERLKTWIEDVTHRENEGIHYDKEHLLQVFTVMMEALEITASHPNAEPLASQWASEALKECAEIVREK
jgi:hypothetical protein